MLDCITLALSSRPGSWTHGAPETASVPHLQRDAVNDAARAASDDDAVLGYSRDVVQSQV